MIIFRIGDHIGRAARVADEAITRLAIEYAFRVGAACGFHVEFGFDEEGRPIKRLFTRERLVVGTVRWERRWYGIRVNVESAVPA